MREIGRVRDTGHIREILTQEREHQIDLATALGIEIPHPKQDG